MTNLAAMGTAHLDRWLLYTGPQIITTCTRNSGHDKQVAALLETGLTVLQIAHTLRITNNSQSGPLFAFLRTVGQLAFMCSTEPQALQPPPNQMREHYSQRSYICKKWTKIRALTFGVESTRVIRTWPWKVTNFPTDKTLSIRKLT